MARTKSAVPARIHEIGDDHKLGPAMQALNEKQRLFVFAMFELGELGDHTQCARAAGYEGTDNSLRVQAHRLAHSEKIQTAIREEAERRNVAILPWAQKRLEAIMLDTGHKDQFGAIKHAQALAGVSPKQVHVVEHRIDREGLIAEVKGALDLLRTLGITVSEVIPGDTAIDVTPLSTDEGIEDIL